MTIGEAIGSQARIIFSIASHDTRVKYSESPLGVVSSLIEPLVTLLVMNLILYYIRARHPRMGDYIILMLATGLLPISAFKNAVAGGEKTFRKFQRLLTLPQLRPLDLMFGGILANLTILILLFVILSMWFKLVMATPEPEDMLMALMPFFGNAAIGFGFCVLNSLIKTWFAFWGRIFGILTAPLAICSGMFYTADTMPPQLQGYLYWNPFMHSTELCRTFFFPEYESDFFDPYYYGAWVLGGLFVGFMLERVYRDRLTGVTR